MSELTTQRTQDNKLKILEGIAKYGGNITKACRYAQLNPCTYYEYIKDDDWRQVAQQATYEAKEERLDAINDSLFEQATDPEKPNVIAGIFLAKSYSRNSKDSNRILSDCPPVELAAPTADNTPSLTDTNQEAIKALMDDYITKLKTTDATEPTKDE